MNEFKDLVVKSLQSIVKAYEESEIGIKECDDCVSRQALLNKAFEIKTGKNTSAMVVYAEDIRKELPILPKREQGEWISVSERLPEKNVWVLVTVEQSNKRYQEIMRRNNYIEAWTDNIDIYTDEIIAWMPIPKYEEGE